MTTGEEKIIDGILEILDLMNAYTPIQQEPANPALGIIRTKLIALEVLRKVSKEKFKLLFLDVAGVTKQITDVKI